MNKYMEQALKDRLNNRLRLHGGGIASTSIPPDWHPDPDLVSSANWLAEYNGDEPVVKVMRKIKTSSTGK